MLGRRQKPLRLQEHYVPAKAEISILFAFLFIKVCMFVRICRFCKHILPSKFYGWCYTFENHAITTHIWALVFHTWWKKMNLVFVHIIKHLPFLDFVLVQLVPNVNSCKNMCKREDKWAAFSWWPRIYSVVTVVVCWTLITFVMWRGGGGIYGIVPLFLFCFIFYLTDLCVCVTVCGCVCLTTASCTFIG